MYKAWLLPLAGALVLASADHHPAGAFLADQRGLIAAFGTGPNAPAIELTQRRAFAAGVWRSVGDIAAVR
jgi:hypothetical protein